ncbi:MAG: hypothetical protein DI598_11625 [Pseudopedobacter saltans]|uniref:Tyr recombinase domain-containing protein n=1 Tax=Pseudopedobacter saltans TaxID=151895 RepID=A0A2W5EZ89_9SPHI|nr:MAG: hypothetical protein DI598_11625 [Pseudopedobacter saltans]
MVTELTKITVINYRKKIALRFSFCGRHTITTQYLYNEINLIKVRDLIEKIQIDILNNNFDFSHWRYVNKKIKKSISFLYDEWAEEKFHDTAYYSLRSIFKDNFDAYKIHRVLEIKKDYWNTQHFNRRKKILTDFYNYLLSISYIKFNPIIDIPDKAKSKTKLINPARLPLTKQEVKRILNAFENDIYCPKFSRVKHSFYYPFVYFLFRYGCRNEEILGLKVCKINIKKREILIDEALAQLPNVKGRVQKSTKTGKARILPLTDDVWELIEPLMMNKAKSDYLFHSPTGSYINPQNFQTRVFYPILRALRIPKRDLYCARHTFISRALEQQMTVAQVAYFAGNTPETIYKFYAHVTEIPTKLPTW